MTNYDKMLFDSVNDIVVYHPKLVEAKRYADQLLKLAPFQDEAPCSEISGPAGVGKSTLWDWIRSEHPGPKEFIEVAVPRGPNVLVGQRPLIALKLQEQPTVTDLCEQFLEALGDPLPAKGTVRDKTFRVDTLLQLCGVSVVVIDEFQYVVDRSGIVSAESIVDWLRDRHMRASRQALGYDHAQSISLCLLGLGRLGAIFSGDGQRLRRWDAGWRMEPYAREGDDFENFAGIVNAFVDSCALPIDPQLDFDDARLISRFHYATWGIAGAVKKLFGAAMRIAALDPKHYPTLSLALLKRAFELQIRSAEYSSVAEKNGVGLSFSTAKMHNSFDSAFKIGSISPSLIDDRMAIAPLARRRSTAQTKREIEFSADRAFSRR